MSCLRLMLEDEWNFSLVGSDKMRWVQAVLFSQIKKRFSRNETELFKPQSHALLASCKGQDRSCFARGKVNVPPPSPSIRLSCLAVPVIPPLVKRLASAKKYAAYPPSSASAQTTKANSHVMYTSDSYQTLFLFFRGARRRKRTHFGKAWHSRAKQTPGRFFPLHFRVRNLCTYLPLGWFWTS